MKLLIVFQGVQSARQIFFRLGSIVLESVDPWKGLDYLREDLRGTLLQGVGTSFERGLRYVHQVRQLVPLYETNVAVA